MSLEDRLSLVEKVADYIDRNLDTLIEDLDLPQEVKQELKEIETRRKQLERRK